MATLPLSTALPARGVRFPRRGAAARRGGASGQGLVVPEHVLPSQICGGPKLGSIVPELRLMLAVLEATVLAYRKFAGSRTRKGRAAFCEARDWLFSDDTAWPFSFVNVCRALDLEPAWLRRRFLRRGPAPSAPRALGEDADAPDERRRA